MVKPPIALETRETSGARLFSPSAGRNKTVIAQKLTPLLMQGAHVLEIASGTGEHGAACVGLRPDLQWQYSDPDAASRASQAAWAAYIGHGLLRPLALDTAIDNWAKGLPIYDGMFCANMIHIAPIEALQGLAAGASTCIAPAGSVVLYGPFLEGAASASSNQDFDRSLKSRNSAWGVRELEFVKHIFAKHGFTLRNRFEMPKNNLLLVFHRAT